MSAHIFDCKKIAAYYFNQAKNEFGMLKSNPGLAIVFNRDVKDVECYKTLIERDAEKLGVSIRKSEVSGKNGLRSSIKNLNDEENVHGIVVLYPLGFKVEREEDIMNSVSPEKDIEGLNAINSGYLVQYKRFLRGESGQKCVVPATAKAIVKTLQFYDLSINQQMVTIINDSKVVGRPTSLMLKNLGATVVNCHDKTRPQDLEAMVRQSDIVITAVPGKEFKEEAGIKGRWIKEGAVVMDVSEYGNFHPNDKKMLKKASYITSQENGLGQVTRAMIQINLGYCSYGLRH